MIGFEEFVRARHSSLLRYAYVLCGDPHLAQDLVQQALARCYPRWSQVSAGRPEAYVRRAVTTAFIDETRRPSWRREIRTELPERADQRDRFRSVDTRDALLVAMDDLSPAQKQSLPCRTSRTCPMTKSPKPSACSAPPSAPTAHAA